MGSERHEIPRRKNRLTSFRGPCLPSGLPRTLGNSSLSLADDLMRISDPKPASKPCLAAARLRGRGHSSITDQTRPRGRRRTGIRCEYPQLRHCPPPKNLLKSTTVARTTQPQGESFGQRRRADARSTSCAGQCCGHRPNDFIATKDLVKQCPEQRPMPSSGMSPGPRRKKPEAAFARTYDSAPTCRSRNCPRKEGNLPTGIADSGRATRSRRSTWAAPRWRSGAPDVILYRAEEDPILLQTRWWRSPLPLAADQPDHGSIHLRQVIRPCAATPKARIPFAGISTKCREAFGPFCMKGMTRAIFARGPG